MKRIQGQANRGAFTLIELLTVIAIIAILIGIMALGMKKATMIAKNMRQKVEFKAIEVGLELFAKDFDDYPDSKTLPAATSANAVCGAQHLAEALLGRDGRGFEPATGWYPPQDELFKPTLGTTNTAIRDSLYDAGVDASLKRRKAPYVEFKHSGVYTIHELWQGNNGSSGIYAPASPPPFPRNRSPVITDSFGRNEITVGTTSVKVGLPVLYFRADGTKPFRIDETARTVILNPVSSQYSKWIYNFDDNLPVITLPVLADPTQPDNDYKDPAAATKTQAQVFYESITQTADTTRNFYKPFNVDTFLLISAGWDGVYGTKDDITNFNY